MPTISRVHNPPTVNAKASIRADWIKTIMDLSFMSTQALLRVRESVERLISHQVKVVVRNMAHNNLSFVNHEMSKLNAQYYDLKMIYRKLQSTSNRLEYESNIQWFEIVENRIFGLKNLIMNWRHKIKEKPTAISDGQDEGRLDSKPSPVEIFVEKIVSRESETAGVVEESDRQEIQRDMDADDIDYVDGKCREIDCCEIKNERSVFEYDCFSQESHESHAHVHAAACEIGDGKFKVDFESEDLQFIKQFQYVILTGVCIFLDGSAGLFSFKSLYVCVVISELLNQAFMFFIRLVWEKWKTLMLCFGLLATMDVEIELSLILQMLFLGLKNLNNGKMKKSSFTTRSKNID